MELTINDKVNGHPAAADIASALGAPSFPDDWCITLDDNLDEDVMIDGEYHPIGTFRVSYIEKHIRRHAVANLDAATLNTMLQRFLVHDKSWRDLCPWESGEEIKARVTTEAAATGTAVRAADAAVPATPSAAMLSYTSLAILGFGGYCAFKLLTQGVSFITDSFPKAEAKLAALTGGMGLAALLLAIAFYSRAKAARSWPKVTGKIIVSQVERDLSGVEDSHSERSYRPVIEFVYTVNGKEYRSRQRQLGTTTSGSQSWANSIKTKYPVGSTVEVSHHPANPADAALENPIGMTWLIFGVSVFCLGVCVHALHLAEK